VEVPLPLLLEETPVVCCGSRLGVVELAAGSPVAEPRPLGAPAGCAATLEIDKASKTAAADSDGVIVNSKAFGFATG
jgi:hypothetical protein